MYQNSLLLLRSPERLSGQRRRPTNGVTMGFWSWLDIPLAVLVLAAARGVPLWIDWRTAVAASGFGTAPAADLCPIGVESLGLAESDERLAEPGCLADEVAPQDGLVLQLTPCPQCGLPAEIRARFRLESTDGPIDHVALSCINDHHFRMAVDRLPVAPLAPVVRAPSSRDQRDSSAANDLVVATVPLTERPPAAVRAGNPAAGGPIAPGRVTSGCEDTEASRN